MGLQLTPEQRKLFARLIRDQRTVRAIRREMEKHGCPLSADVTDAEIVISMRGESCYVEGDALKEG